MFVIQIHILYAVWCYPDRREGRRYPPSHCCQGIGYLLARSVLYEALAILAAAYPADVILVNHIQSIQWCADRARRRVLPIRRIVRTMPWSTPQRGQSCDARCTKGILLIISNPLKWIGWLVTRLLQRILLF